LRKVLTLDYNEIIFQNKYKSIYIKDINHFNKYIYKMMIIFISIIVIILILITITATFPLIMIITNITILIVLVSLASHYLYLDINVGDLLITYYYIQIPILFISKRKSIKNQRIYFYEIKRIKYSQSNCIIYLQNNTYCIVYCYLVPDFILKYNNQIIIEGDKNNISGKISFSILKIFIYCLKLFNI